VRHAPAKPCDRQPVTLPWRASSEYAAECGGPVFFSGKESRRRAAIGAEDRSLPMLERLTTGCAGGRAALVKVIAEPGPDARPAHHRRQIGAGT